MLRWAYRYRCALTAGFVGIAALIISTQVYFTEPNTRAAFYSTAESKKFRVLMVGASGATGIPTVNELLKSSNLDKLTLLSRRKQERITDSRVEQVVVDFDKLSEVKLESNYDVIISTMGTTRAQCRDAAEYRTVEVVYPVQFAKLGIRLGAKHAVLVSSIGAKKGSYLGPYLSQKGEVEDEWKIIGFDTLTILKPGLLGRGEKMRVVEKISSWISTPIPCEIIGKAIASRVENVVAASAKEDSAMIQTNVEIYKQLQLMEDNKQK